MRNPILLTDTRFARLFRLTAAVFMAAIAVLAGLSSRAEAQAAYNFCPAGAGAIFNVVNGVQIWRLDPPGGTAIRVAELDQTIPNNLNGLMVDPMRNRLLFVSRPTSTTTQLWAYDAANGGWYDAAGGAFASPDFPRAAISPSGTGYLIGGGTGPEVWRVTASGGFNYTVQNIGNLSYNVAPTDTNSGDIAFDGNGIAWLAVGQDLYTVDLQGGSLTAIRQARPLLNGSPSTINWAGIAFGADGRLYVARNSATDTYYAYDPATGNLTPAGTAAGGARDLASCAFPVLAGPELSVAKTLAAVDGAPYVAGSPISADDVLTYRITVTNTGGAAGTLFPGDVDETVPANTTFVSAGSNFTCTGINCSNNASYNVPANGGTTTLDFVVQVDDPLPGTVSNIDNAVTVAGVDCAAPGNDCVESTPVGMSVSVAKSSSPASGMTVSPGDTITYTLTATIAGSATTEQATLTDTLGAGLTLTGVTSQDPQFSGPCGVAGQTLTCALPAGSPVGAYAVTYTATVAATATGNVTNAVTATNPPGGDPDPVCTTCTTAHPVPAAPAITIDKTGTLNDADGDGLIDLGETISYAFLVENTGNVTLTNVTVNDPLVTVNEGPQTLAPGGSFTFTATYTPTQADIDAGQVENTATGTGTPPSGPPVDSPPDTVTVPPDETPGLTIDKTGTLNDADGDGLIDLGETISYAFLVENTGNVTLTNVTVNDPLVTVNEGPQTLAPGGSFTFTATYTPTQADIDAGSVENTATGTGTPPSGPPVDSPPDTVTVPPDETPADVTKTKQLVNESGAAAGIAEPGEQLTYEITLTNSGGAATNYAVQDVLDVNTSFVSADNGGVDNGATVDWSGLTVPAQVGATPGILVLSVQVTVADPLPAGVVQLTNIAKEPGEPDPECPSDQCVVTPVQDPTIALLKTGTYEDADGNGLASPGDIIRYGFVVANTGNVPLADVSPQDPGPTFNGRNASNSLSDFTPATMSLEPGEEQSFTATYTLAQADIDNGAGIQDGVENTATARGYANGSEVTGSPVDSDESVSVLALPAAASDISIAKIAGLRHIRRGEQAPFTIRVTNNSGSRVTGLTVVDTMPSGFRFVEGSATIAGVAVTPVVTGRSVVFENVAVDGNSEIEIRLRMLALSSAGPGEHVNKANVTDPSGRPLAPEATATVEILVEPVFDCGDIIGKVFDDVDRNGYQDDGELGLPGVRIATAKGWLVTTDKHGRFHVPCAALPDQRIGSNFIMKLDTRTLPTGYRVTTENPRVVRLTAGKMTKLNFGASIGRVVRLDLKDEAFEAGSTELKQRWAEGIDQLIEVLGKEQSVLRLSYIDANADAELVEERLKLMSDLIKERWRERRGRYRLEIETRVEVGE
jgi:uncharacterized repeat protein (TIGR01451 family)/fimbrial isopeptide formation D2 family protein